MGLCKTTNLFCLEIREVLRVILWKKYLRNVGLEDYTPTNVLRDTLIPMVKVI